MWVYFACTSSQDKTFGFVVLESLVIQPRYAKLVRTNSRFWNSSGLDVDFGLFSGADIRASSVENLLRGGVSFATPDEAGSLAGAGRRFELNKEPEDEWLEWAPVLGWR